MSQGLLMFDAEGRLVICNRRYLDDVQPSPEQVKPGMHLASCCMPQQAIGTFVGDPDYYIAEICRAMSQRRDVQPRCIELPDGRTIRVNQPMPSGGWVATHEDITERRRAEKQIAHMARHDALTDLPNRVLLRERLEQALTACRPRRQRSRCSISISTISRASTTRSAIRSATSCSRCVAERLRRCVRESDTVARVGGDEFAIVQTGVDAAERRGHAGAPRVRGDPARPTIWPATPSSSTPASASRIAPDDGADAGRLLKNADMALYRAKADGRGTYRFFEPEMDAAHQGAPRAGARPARGARRRANSSCTTSRWSISTDTASPAARR